MTFELSFLDTMVGYISTLRQRLTESSPSAGQFRVVLRAQDVTSPRKTDLASCEHPTLRGMRALYMECMPRTA